MTDKPLYEDDDQPIDDGTFFLTRVFNAQNLKSELAKMIVDSSAAENIARFKKTTDEIILIQNPDKLNPEINSDEVLSEDDMIQLKEIAYFSRQIQGVIFIMAANEIVKDVRNRQDSHYKNVVIATVDSYLSDPKKVDNYDDILSVKNKLDSLRF